MLRTQRPLKVAQYASEKSIRDLLHHLNYPSSFSMKVEIKAGELYFSNVTQGIEIQIPENSWIGFPSFNTGKLLIPEFDGEYLLSNLVVEYGNSSFAPTIIRFVDGQSQINLVGKAETTLNRRYGLL